MTAVLAFVLPLAAGWALVAAALATIPARPVWAARLIETSLGAGAGVAISSMAFFLLTLGGLASPAAILSFNAALAAAGLFAFWRTRGLRDAKPLEPAPPSKDPAPSKPAAPSAFRWNWLLALALAAGFALVLYGLVSVSAASPFGEWDAWSIWNLRAKFMAGAGGAWRGALSSLPDKAGMHPDYPLLLSGFIGMVWKAAGETPAWVPQVTAFLFLSIVASLVAGALAVLRGATAALLAGLVLLANTSFLFFATMQYADLPVGFYVLASLALLFAAESAPAALALSGAFASFAAWTKNEGAAFALFLAVAILATNRRAIACFLAGAAPGLLLVVSFKLFLAPPSEPLFHQTVAQLAHKLADPSRYLQIGKALATEVWHLGLPWSHPLLLLAILAVALRFRIDPAGARAWRAAAIALGLAFAADLAVYLITPSDLAWHLQTSLSRLCGQLWPSFLLLAFLALDVPCAAAPKPAAKPLRRGQHRS